MYAHLSFFLSWICITSYFFQSQPSDPAKYESLRTTFYKKIQALIKARKGAKLRDAQVVSTETCITIQYYTILVDMPIKCVADNSYIIIDMPITCVAMPITNMFLFVFTPINYECRYGLVFLFVNAGPCCIIRVGDGSWDSLARIAAATDH